MTHLPLHGAPCEGVLIDSSTTGLRTIVLRQASDCRGEIAPGVSEAMTMGLAKPWVCVFQSLSGEHARARFVSKDQAKQFAERHARSFIPASTALTWEDTDDSSVLAVQIGDYLITHSDEYENDWTSHDARPAPQPRR
jgi:hypothetical protein